MMFPFWGSGIELRAASREAGKIKINVDFSKSRALMGFTDAIKYF
jgi:hypothetical protein